MRRVYMLTVLALVGTFGLPALAHAQEDMKETYEAFAVAMGTSNPPVMRAGRSTVLQINITRWSTDEEREMLLAQLVENGPEGLVKQLRKEEETGWVRVTGQGANRNPFPSERLRYARQYPMGEGRRIVLALDRYISLSESARQPRWRDYDVSLIVMDVDAEGNGEGQLAMAVKLSIDDDKRLVVENFGTEPVRLTNIRRRN